MSLRNRHRGRAAVVSATRYRMPAEWEPHAATLLAWPHETTDWPGKFAAIKWVYVEIVRHLHLNEQVVILVNSLKQKQNASQVLQKGAVDLGRVRFYRVPTDRGWMRDAGPIGIIRNANMYFADWHFNGWAKYDDWRSDDAVAGRLAKNMKVRRIMPRARNRRIVLEGGSVDVNGVGSLLTTEQCMLSTKQARNPHLDREDLEVVFAKYLGARNILWLADGIVGDDTHGHVDDIARFVDPRTVVVAVESNRGDDNYAPTHENLRRLKKMRDQSGRRIRIVTLPMPAPLSFDGTRLPASYANFYIANKLVIVPTFNDPADRVALRTLDRLFPGRTVVGIHCVDLVLGLGTLHCLTQQIPGVSSRKAGDASRKVAKAQSKK